MIEAEVPSDFPNFEVTKKEGIQNTIEERKKNPFK